MFYKARPSDFLSLRVLLLERHRSTGVGPSNMRAESQPLLPAARSNPQDPAYGGSNPARQSGVALPCCDSPRKHWREEMNSEENSLLVRVAPEQPQGSTRRTFLHRAAIAGAVGVGSLLPLALPDAKASALLGRDDHDDDSDDLKGGDHNILIAAEIAEALAVTTYTNIIDGSPFFSRLPSDDQGYLVAAR